MMGILLSAMAGAGDAGVQSMNQNIAQMNALDLEQQRANLAEQKAKSLAVFNNNLAVDTSNQQRQAMADRIAAAKSGILDTVMGQKYAPSDAAVADAANGLTDAPLTPDQLAAIAQAKENDRATLAADPHLDVKAGIQTGDITPKDAAMLTNKQDLMEMRSSITMQGIQSRLEASRDRTDMMMEIAKLRAATGGTDGKLPSDAKMIGYLVKNSGLSQKDATDRVLGTGFGAMKDPAGMAASLASSLIASGAVRVPKDAPPGTTLASVAFDMAMGQIRRAEDNFHTGGPAPAPAAAAPSVPNPAAAPKPFNPTDFMSGGDVPARPASAAPSQNAAPAAASAATPAATPAAAPAAAPPAVARDKDKYYAADDPVVSELDRSIASLVRTDPTNTKTFQSLVAAKNQRLDQLRANYGNNLAE